MRFEDVMKAMKKMSPGEIQAAMDENANLCICPSCPTYVGTGESKVFFCGMAQSEIISEEKGCTCPDCPVTEKMGLRWQYYCTKGTGGEQLAQEASAK